MALEGGGGSVAGFVGRTACTRVEEDLVPSVLDTVHE